MEEKDCRFQEGLYLVWYAIRLINWYYGRLNSVNRPTPTRLRRNPYHDTDHNFELLPHCKLPRRQPKLTGKFLAREWMRSLIGPCPHPLIFSAKGAP